MNVRDLRLLLAGVIAGVGATLSWVLDGHWYWIGLLVYLVSIPLAPSRALMKGSPNG